MAAPRLLRLRRWQRDALDKLRASDQADFLAVATPGAGKTTFALTGAALFLKEHPQGRVVVVAPTAHLKQQWAAAAGQFGLALTPMWSPSGARLPADLHGIVTTYQQVASAPDAVKGIAAHGFAILDELHHAGDEKAWGDGVRKAFTTAARRLALSGTPFRSDTTAIPFIRYAETAGGPVSAPDFEYGYAEALRDSGVVRTVFFPRINGFMEWTAPDGTMNAASFEDALDAQRSAQRLRTALSLDGEWLPTVLVQAHEQLERLREKRPDAGGLVIATDQDHARRVAEVLRRRTGSRVTVALSDDPDASNRIAAFTASTDPWIVAVRMVSEGVDIPRLVLGVFATTTTTELFFRQAVGRLVRHTGRATGERAFLFIPDDPRLRTWAHTIAESRRHALRPPPTEDDTDGADSALDDHLLEAANRPEQLEQLSLFSVLTAVVEGEVSVFDEEESPDADGAGRGDADRVDAARGGPFVRSGVAGGSVAGGSVAGDGTADSSGDGRVPPDEADAAPAIDDGLVLDLDALSGALARVPGADPRLALTHYRRLGELRDTNAELAKDLVRFTGQSHRAVNGELNRQAGVKTVEEATLAQLERRAARAQAWIDQLRGGRRP